MQSNSLTKEFFKWSNWKRRHILCVFIPTVLIRPCWIFQNLISLQLALVVMFLIKWWSNQRAIQFISCFEVRGTYKFITRVLSTQAGPILKFVTSLREEEKMSSFNNTNVQLHVSWKMIATIKFVWRAWCNYWEKWQLGLISDKCKIAFKIVVR